MKRGSTSPEYILARLQRDHPALAAQVEAGTLSAHAAAIQAGIRKATWAAPTDPAELAVAIERRFPGWHLRRDEPSAEDHHHEVSALQRARFYEEVIKEVEARMPKEAEEYKRLIKEASQSAREFQMMRNGIAAQMTPDEHRLLLNVLHPDRAPEDRRDRFAKAFDIVRKLDAYIAVVAKRRK